MERGLTSEQRLWRWRILISTYLGYGGYYLTRKVFTLYKTTLADEWGVQVASTAHIWFAFLAAYMVGQFVSSYAGRRWGPRLLLLGGLGISIVINTIFGFSNSFYTFLGFMIINGLAQGSGWPGAVGAVALWLRPKERGTIMGVWTTSYAVGNAAVKTIAPILGDHFGWRWAFWGCSLGASAIWLLVLVWQRNKPEDVGLEPIVDPAENEERRGHAVDASQAERVSYLDYARLALNPVVLAMGTSYFCVKFLRYALDSWLPAFLNIQGLDVARAGLYSQVFDWMGFAGAIVAGLLLDKVFRGNWAVLCFLLSLGMVLGYIAVIYLGTSPLMIAVCFGFVGFMLYGPDTIMSGTACIEVAGERNGVALAGIVNGVGSIGPLVQEQVIGWLMRDKNHIMTAGLKRIEAGLPQGAPPNLAAVEAGLKDMETGWTTLQAQAQAGQVNVDGFRASIDSGIEQIRAGLSAASHASATALDGIQAGAARLHEVMPDVVRLSLDDGIRNTNRLALGMSVLFAALMIVMMYRLHVVHKAKTAGRESA